MVEKRVSKDGNYRLIIAATSPKLAVKNSQSLHRAVNYDELFVDKVRPQVNVPANSPGDGNFLRSNPRTRNFSEKLHALRRDPVPRTYKFRGHRAISLRSTKPSLASSRGIFQMPLKK